MLTKQLQKNINLSARYDKKSAPQCRSLNLHCGANIAIGYVSAAATELLTDTSVYAEVFLDNLDFGIGGCGCRFIICRLSHLAAHLDIELDFGLCA